MGEVRVTRLMTSLAQSSGPWRWQRLAELAIPTKFACAFRAGFVEIRHIRSPAYAPQKRKKPTWSNTLRYSTTSAYSSTSLPELLEYSSSSHPTTTYISWKGTDLNLPVSHSHYFTTRIRFGKSELVGAHGRGGVSAAARGAASTRRHQRDSGGGPGGAARGRNRHRCPTRRRRAAGGGTGPGGARPEPAPAVLERERRRRRRAAAGHGDAWQGLCHPRHGSAKIRAGVHHSSSAQAMVTRLAEPVDFVQCLNRVSLSEQADFRR
jgi:hypothetical protein